MSLYYVVSYRDERDRLIDVARVDGDVKRDALRRVVQALADKIGKRLEVRKTDTAVPHARPAEASSRFPKRNPSKRRRATKAKPSAKDQAKKMFKKWHQFESTRTVRMKGSRSIPARLVKLGELPEIVYRSDKWTGKQQLYLHKTGKPRPLLCTDPEGKRFFIVGGRMRATARGIVG